MAKYTVQNNNICTHSAVHFACVSCPQDYLDNLRRKGDMSSIHKSYRRSIIKTHVRRQRSPPCCPVIWAAFFDDDM